MELAELVREIPRRGLSADCQEHLEKVAEAYFSGRDLNYVFAMVGKRNRGSALKIWNRLEELFVDKKLKRDLARKIASETGQAYQDLIRDDSEAVFVKEAIEFLGMEEKYSAQLKSPTELRKLARTPGFYRELEKKL